MPLVPSFTLFIGWSAVMSLVALLYGGYVGARHAGGRPVGGREWLRNFLALFAVAVNLSFLLLIAWTRLPVLFVFHELRALLLFSWTPLLIWYVFDLPNRAVRNLIARRRARGQAPHPLDGAWPAAASFLDEINAHRNDPPGGRSGAHPPSTALDQVARLHPLDSPPGNPTG